MILHYTFPYCKGNYYDEISNDYYREDVNFIYEIDDEDAFEVIENRLRNDLKGCTEEELQKELDSINIYDYRDLLTEYFEDDAYDSFRS